MEININRIDGIFNELLIMISSFKISFGITKNNKSEYSHRQNKFKRICISKHLKIEEFFMKTCIKLVGLVNPNNIFRRLERNRICATRLNAFMALNGRFCLVWNCDNEHFEIQIYLESKIHQIDDLMAFFNADGRDENREALQTSLLKFMGILAAVLSADDFGSKIARVSVFDINEYGSLGRSITRCVHL